MLEGATPSPNPAPLSHVEKQMKGASCPLSRSKQENSTPVPVGTGGWLAWVLGA